MAIIYINMLSRACTKTFFFILFKRRRRKKIKKNLNPNSWEGLKVARRLVSSLPDGKVRLRLARLLRIDFRFELEIKSRRASREEAEAARVFLHCFSPNLIK